MQPTQSTQDRQDRLHRWAIDSVVAELRVLGQMEDHNIGKPGSPYSVSVLKIASICKGAGAGYLDRFVVYELIQERSAHLHVPEREAMRVFSRAMKNARPRFPKE